MGGSPIRAQPTQLRGAKAPPQALSASQPQRKGSVEAAEPMKDSVHLLESTLGVWTRSIKAVLAIDPDACLEVLPGPNFLHTPELWGMRLVLYRFLFWFGRCRWAYQSLLSCLGGMKPCMTRTN